MYQNYYGEISIEPCDRKGYHVQTFDASHPRDRDKKTEEFLNDMDKRHGDKFKIISVSNPMMMSMFSTQVTYSIA